MSEEEEEERGRWCTCGIPIGRHTTCPTLRLPIRSPLSLPLLLSRAAEYIQHAHCSAALARAVANRSARSVLQYARIACARARVLYAASPRVCVYIFSRRC